ncbi:MAG: sodium:proton antiporter [Epulopiscium sp.]|jgi:multicomponent Na+:H+ antiporter subunit F|nr:sodium:proton antiporter [Candidatus Epulonipiscium sp.]
MVQSSSLLYPIFIGCMIVLSASIFLCFIRAVKGPRFTDRVVAINMIGTLAVAFICMLSVYLEETALVDIALVYTMLSFLAVVILCRVVTFHHKGRLLFLKRKEAEKAKGKKEVLHD